MTDRDLEKERLERATRPAGPAALDDAESADLIDGWRALTDALTPLCEMPLNQDLLISQVRWRARRASARRGFRWLLAASVLVAAVASWPERSSTVATVDPPKGVVATAVVSEDTQAPAAGNATGPWNDELETELLAIEAEFQRVERRWRTPPDSFASVRWRMQELEQQVTQSSL